MNGTGTPEAAAFLRRRRAALAADPTADPARLGLDFIEVLPAADGVASRRRLVLHFIPAAAGATARNRALDRLTAASFHFTAGGVPVDGLFTVAGIEHPDPLSEVLTATVDFAGESSLDRRLGSDTVFTLELADDPDRRLVIDPFFARLDFSLDPDLPLGEDPAATAPIAAGASSDNNGGAGSTQELAGDYLAKDFASFRQKMLDSLAQSLPTWQERNPADLLITLTELLADAADQASYYQDAVATEAYLGTARLRSSVRRHARLLGYTVREGTAARVWAAFTAAGNGRLPAGTRLFTRVSGLPAALGTADQVTTALAAAPTVFETQEAIDLAVAHNALPLYDWGAPEIGLPAGATRATLVGSSLSLSPGDVLILEETAGPTGDPEGADPEHRQAVRLTRVTEASDPLAEGGPVELTEIEWHEGDALPFPLPIARRVDGSRITGLAVARGNVALADHGRTTGEGEVLTAPAGGRFRPALARTGLTHRVPYDAASPPPSATATLAADPAAALPVLELFEVPSGRPWTLRRDLLASDRFARDYVVEMEDDGRAVLRFGDGTLGLPPAPGTRLAPRYRVGNGRSGNIGRDSLYHVAAAGTAAAAVRNPLPARGGTDAESIESVQLAAPGTLRALEGRTAEEGFSRLAESHPEVERATATLRWGGSWYVLEVAVERADGRPADAEFLGRVRAFLEDHRQAGWEIEVVPVRFVGLDIALTARLAPGAARGEVERALGETFGNRDLPGGGRGFFHPDDLTFGQPVYLSRIVVAALGVPGVVAVDTNDEPPRQSRFRRYGEPSRGELAAGEIRLGRAEVARVDNNPAAPSNGRIRFFLEGGR